jgi:ABC transporter/Transcriptional regulator PadR-like family
MVYATLGRLERDGCVTSVGQDQGGGPERTSYQLTEAGRVVLDQWLSEVEPPMPHIASTLLAKVLVALLAADEATRPGRGAQPRNTGMNHVAPRRVSRGPRKEDRERAVPIITARGVVRSYGRTAALRGVSLRVAEGEILAVTGPSGCAKSTLLPCLSGILRPGAGEVSYRGERIDSWSQARRSRLRRTEFGVLFQFGQLVAELSAAENVALPLLLAGGRREDQRAAGGADRGSTGSEGGHTSPLCFDRADVVAIPTFVRAVAVPWTHLGVLAGGAVVLVAVMMALSLSLLRTSTDIAELRVS